MDVAPINTNMDISPYTLFAVGANVYGVTSDNVLSIEILKNSTPLVNAPDYTRGIVDFRGDMIQIIDLRRLFNMGKRGERLRHFFTEQSSRQREQFDKLSEAVAKGQAYPIEQPEDSELGKWMASFKSDHSSVTMHIQQMHGPHQTIHHLEQQASKLAQDGKIDEAKVILRDIQSLHMGHLMELISQAADVFVEAQREMLVVLCVEDRVKGIIVDEIVSVEYITKMIEMPENASKSKYVTQLARRDKDNSTVLLLEERLIMTL